MHHNPHHNQQHQPPPEVIVKIDGGNVTEEASPSSSKNDKHISRDSSLEFWKDDANKGVPPRQPDDPPSKLIGQFLNKQKAAGGEMSLDIDLEMDEFRNDVPTRSPTTFVPLSKDFSKRTNNADVDDIIKDKIRPAKHSSSSSSSSSSGDDIDDRASILNRRRSTNVTGNLDPNGNDGAVLRCSSIQRRYSGLGMNKTRSRLMDPHEILDKRSETMLSNPARSGLLPRPSGLLFKPPDEDEDDPLFDEDIPDEYKKAKVDALTIAECISLVLLVTGLISTLAIARWKSKQFRGLSLWKWEVVVLVLICGRLVSGWVIRIAVFFIERNFFMRKRILYFVYGVRKAVQNCIWLGLLLIAWHSVFDRQLEVNNRFLWYVNRFMVCLVVGTFLWLLKTLMVKVLASSFHVSTFFDRIQESLFNQYVIETLSGPPLIEIRHQQEEEERTMMEVWRLHNGGAVLPPELKSPDLKSIKSELRTPDLKSIRSGKVGSISSGALPPKSSRMSFRQSQQLPNEQGIPIEKLHKLNHKNISAWNMKRLIKIVKHGLLTTLDERVLDSSDESSTQIKSEVEAISAARQIFKNVAKPKAKYIYLEDLMRFLREEESEKVLTLLEGSPESERISKVSLKNWMVNAFVERRALALTLNDTKTAVNNLHQMVNVLIGILIAILCVIILRFVAGKLLLYISSQIVVVAFIFGNTLRTIFEAVIFVFVMHPFDVGDRCEVDGVQMVVEEMNILTTVFLRYDNQKILYPNVTLATRPISNYYRSPDMGDSVDFSVHIATPAEKIALMKQRITNYIDNKSDYWYTGPMIVLMDLIGLNALKLSVWLRHRMNHQNIGEKWRRRAILVEEMVKIFKELDIEYRMYPKDINIRAMPSGNSTRLPSSWNLPPTPPPHIGN